MKPVVWLGIDEVFSAAVKLGSEESFAPAERKSAMRCARAA